jgi:hypothetical protein
VPKLAKPVAVQARAGSRNVCKTVTSPFSWAVEMPVLQKIRSRWLSTSRVTDLKFAPNGGSVRAAVLPIGNAL